MVRSTTFLKHQINPATNNIYVKHRWPNWESTYLYLWHSPCRFLTVERRIMSEQLRWRPGSPRNNPAFVSLPDESRGHFPWSPVQHGLSMRRYGCCTAWPRCPDRNAPSLYAETVWTVLFLVFRRLGETLFDLIPLWKNIHVFHTRNIYVGESICPGCVKTRQRGWSHLRFCT